MAWLTLFFEKLVFAGHVFRDKTWIFFGAVILLWIVWWVLHHTGHVKIRPAQPGPFWRFIKFMIHWLIPATWLYAFGCAFTPEHDYWPAAFGMPLYWYLVKVYQPSFNKLARLSSLPRFAWLRYLGMSRKPKSVILSGWQPLTTKQLIALTKKDAGILTIGGVPIPSFAEVMHVLFRGGTGVGKTKAIIEVMQGARAAKMPCIVVDPAGELMKRYGKPTDFYLSPFDARSHKIDIRDYLTDDASARTLANIVIPTNTATEEKKGWSQWAQNLFVPVLDAIRNGARLSDELLLHMFTTEDKSMLKKRGFWTGTSAAAVFLEGNEKWFSGMRGVLSEQLTFLTYPYAESAPKLNLEEWVDRSTNEAYDSVLWLPFPRQHREALRPLYSIIISIVANRLMQLVPNDDDRPFERRMFFVLDELAKLGRVDKLQDLLEEGRKHGAVVVAGFQHDEQMVQSFGRESANIILNLFNTRVLFRPSDAEIASKDSKRAGAYIEQRYTEGSSSNSSNNGQSNGRSVSEQITSEIAAVPYTDLLGLPNLHGYLIIQHLPPAKIEIPILKHTRGPDDPDVPFIVPTVPQKRPLISAEGTPGDDEPASEDASSDGSRTPRKRRTSKPLRPRPKDPDHLRLMVRNDGDTKPADTADPVRDTGT